MNAKLNVWPRRIPLAGILRDGHCIVATGIALSGLAGILRDGVVEYGLYLLTSTLNAVSTANPKKSQLAITWCRSVRMMPPVKDAANITTQVKPLRGEGMLPLPFPLPLLLPRLRRPPDL